MSATAPFWLSAFLDFTDHDFERGVVFWAEVTGSRVSAPRGEDLEFATLVPRHGDAVLRVQRLVEGHSGLHLDLHVTDPRAAAARAVDLGAVEVADHGYVVMRSPAGLTFCFVTHHVSRPPTPVAWPGGRSAVDQVCLDVGPASYDAECAFWQELTGFAPTPTVPPDGEFRRLDGPGPLRILLQRLDDDREPGFHLDLSADDRAAEVTRHQRLGATVTAEHPQWTVLTDPTGTTYCVTDRSPVPTVG
ncbi:VOC family protein [Nocardioides rubriscoriae]|uniref:VOC family protein n=1 Tax=Nocardioides rubriscoriae TaxID=642762 RepID=UPI0011DF40A4|nr:VOC family protein [Nocardioides rubriscoriae]